MSSLKLAVGYLIVVLHEFWADRTLIQVGRVLEVERPLRNELVGSGVARDATDEEIAAYRDDQAPSGEGGDDDRPTAADLAAAKAQLEAVEAERDALQDQAKALEGQVGTLTSERDTLRAELDALKAKPAKATKGDA